MVGYLSGNYKTFLYLVDKPKIIASGNKTHLNLLHLWYIIRKETLIPNKKENDTAER